MSLLEVNNIKFKYTDKDLYNDLSFKLNDGEHAVLVGANGSGKSTLMNIISKNISPDAGEIKWLPHISYSYLDQHLKVKQDVSIKDYIYEVFSDLFLKEKQMEEYFAKIGSCNENEYERILNRALAIQEELEEKNFYAMNSTVGNIINGLGIAAYGLDTKLSHLSGGQRAKVYLAKMLLEGKDVLLMDEPTNFLDIAHIEWLTKYLQSYNQAFIVISHDEAFLDGISNVVFALENKQITRYKGNYQYYLTERELRREQYENAYASQQKFIKQTQAFIDKNIVRATSSKAAKSRRKMLEHIEVLDKPAGNIKMHFNFKFSKDLGHEVIKFENLEVGYTKAILPPLNYLITKNQKVAILGRNGVGKSTILKTILGLIPPISGTYKFNPSADINYFSQDEVFNANDTPIMYIRGFYPLMTDGEIRSVLGAVGINKDLVLKKMSELSGGEQTKVRIALMTIKKSNLIILDEPTNHLDVRAKEYLFKALENFPGCVILVSHEKDFYDGLVDYEIVF